MGVRIFSNEDIDAPILKDQPGSLINILKACLIDGYGTGADETLPHGSWEIITNSNNQKAAIRSTDANANGYWLYLDDTFNEYAEVAMAETFTGFDGSDNPNTDTVWLKAPETNRNWAKTESPDISPWKVISDERFFFWIHMSSVQQSAFDNNGWPGAWAGRDQTQFYDPSNGSYQAQGWQTSGNGFGDLIDGRPSDNDNTIMSATTNTFFSNNQNNENGAIGQYFRSLNIFSARGLNITDTGIETEQQFLGTGASSPAASGDRGEEYPAIGIPNGLIFTNQPVFFSENPNSNGTKEYRGRLPGVFPITMRIGEGPQQGFSTDYVKWGTYSTPFAGTAYDGRTFTLTGLATGDNSSQRHSIAFIDLTGPWR